MNASAQNSPAGTDYLAGIIKSVLASAEAEGADTGRKADTAQTSAKESAPTADLFSSLLSNPELLAKLPSLISTVKPMMELLSARPSPPTAAAAVQLNEERAKPTSAAEKKDDGADRRAALLCAMKPYLSPDRQNAIDYIIKLSRLGDMLKSL